MKAIKIIAASIMLLCGALFANAQPGGMRGQGGQRGPGGQQMDPEQMVQMRVDRLKETLKLTADQVTKVTAVFKKQNEDMAKLMQGGQPDMEAFQKLRENETAELKKILTADQFKAYEESMQRGFGGGRGQGGPGGGREGIQMRQRQ